MERSPKKKQKAIQSLIAEPESLSLYARETRKNSANGLQYTFNLMTVISYFSVLRQSRKNRQINPVDQASENRRCHPPELLRFINFGGGMNVCHHPMNGDEVTLF
jgi:hypothetical protein